MPESIYEKVQVKLASTIFSSIAGGQGIMMDFSQTEPEKNDILYLQNSVDEFFELASSYIQPSGTTPVPYVGDMGLGDTGNEGDEGDIGDIGDTGDFEGGKKKNTKNKKAN
jgi:hypothetical protein